MSIPDLGGVDDSVRLDLGGDELLIAEDWDVFESVLETPATFSLTLGKSTPFVNMFTRPAMTLPYPGGPKYPPGTPFTLSIGGSPQMAGKYEGFRFHEGDANRITIMGRDQLCALMKAHSAAQRSFLDGTYTDLVDFAIRESSPPGRQYTIHESNAATRQIKAGVPIKVITEPTLVDQINAGGASGQGALQGAATATVGAVATHSERQNRITESMLSFCRRHLDRAGLFLWSGHVKDVYVLSQPNGAQQPIYRITRKRGQKQDSNVVKASYWVDTSDRHSACIVYGRNGGAAQGRAKFSAGEADQEIADIGILPGNAGFFEPVLYRDVNVENTQQAAFFARRKLAEERRRGWGLVYTVRGHRAPGLNVGDPWPVLTIDTVIAVEDDEFGLGPSDPEKGLYYIESVRRMRRPETVTQIRLMRISDLIFGTGGIA